MPIVTGITQIETVTAQQPRPAATQQRAQTVQHDTLIQHLRTALRAQFLCMRDRTFARAHRGVPDQADGDANG